MNRTLIIARITPGTEPAVAGVFAASDASLLPRDLGVRRRSLYALHDLYAHLVEFDGDARAAMRRAQRHPGFADVSARLQPYVRPYDPHWRGPEDAVAHPFYHWSAE
ncbi:MAG TPA: TcmI family type II polyketide cyclase [Pilimelia sp.]|nr:TcmI family type II polyketide cyclase [Pilimelia sp.]